MPEELATFLEVLEGGKTVTGEVVQFPTDVAAGTALEGTVTETVAANGAASSVSQLTVVEGGASTTAGVGLLALDVGVAGAAIAPALGIAAGVGLYNLSPTFWTNVSNALMNAGETIGGKVRAFVNEDGQLGLSENAINIFKNALLDANAFNSGIISQPEGMGQNIALPISPGLKWTQANTDENPSLASTQVGVYLSAGTVYPVCLGAYSVYPNGQEVKVAQFHDNSSNRDRAIMASKTLFSGTFAVRNGWNPTDTSATSWTFDDKTVYFKEVAIPTIFSNMMLPVSSAQASANQEITRVMAWLMIYGTYVQGADLQPGATYPTKNDSVTTTYPDWIPWDLPIELPSILPIEVPIFNENSNQNQAQNPQPIPDNQKGNLLNWLLNQLNLPDPIPDPIPSPVPVPDPDPIPPDPIPIPPDPIPPDPIPPDPIPPDPVPPPPVIPIIPIIDPDTVESNAMFTVYRPSMSQINSFGGWLWTSSIIEQIVRMWQNPLDGIISLQKVYAEPTVGGSQNIVVGYLDSGVSAPVVTSQFVTVDCGTVAVNEYLQNATDYPPYTQLSVYLPFIGMVELDTTDFMNGSMSIEYGIDVYTGTCLAAIKATRAGDMPNATALYTFSGNASQQLPLTSVSFGGAIQTLVSAVGGGLAVASGGALAGVAGMAALGSSLTHEMVHVSRGGSLSSNAGIMGARKPYIIISRQHSYDAAWYNQMYGYPANKTVYIGNCSGFVRVKKCLIHSRATEAEIEEMYSLLENGVIA